MTSVLAVILFLLRRDCYSFFFFFFFQAEDGIRDVAVTGVQTCALPISHVHRVLIAVRGEHAPPHIVARRQRQERGASIPVPRPKAPRETPEVEREPRVYEGPEDEAHGERRPAGGGSHRSEFSREACPARFSSCILTAYDARQRSRRRRIGGGSRARALSERVPDLPPRGVPEHLLARRARRPHAPAHRGVFRSLAGARSVRLVRRVVGRPVGATGALRARRRREPRGDRARAQRFGGVVRGGGGA